MARYTGEARITFNGDRALAARYVSEGRKYLGGLMVTSPVETAVRELTNPDGVHFRVGYFGGVPFIEITAGRPVDDKYLLGVIRGYVTSPRTASFTFYSSTPSVIINPFSGVDNLWPSTFYDRPLDLNAATHPTSGFTDAFSAYGAYFPSLPASAGATTFAHSLPRMMSWNNADESLWLYWEGCGHARNSHTALAALYLNAKMVLDLNYILPYQAMLMGASAKRTSSGLTVYMTVMELISGTVKKFSLSSVKLVPTVSEKARLDKFGGEPAYGYASEYDADVGTYTEIYQTSIVGAVNYYSAFPHNQKASQARGFLGINTGGALVLSEYVLDYSDLAAVAMNAVGSASFVQTNIETKVFGDTVHFGNLVRHVNQMSDPDYATRAPGIYTYSESTAPYVQTRWTAKDNHIFPATYAYNKKTTLNIQKIKCMVDYRDDVPVYAYMHISDDIDEISSSSTYSLSVTEPISELVVEVFDTEPVTATQTFTSSVSWSLTYNATYSKARQIRTIGISAPLYDSSGAEVGDWLNETELSSSWETKTASGSNSMLAHRQPDNDFSSILFGHLLSPGCSVSRSPMYIGSGSETRSISIYHLNLRTRSALYVKNLGSSLNQDTRTFGAMTFDILTSAWHDWIENLAYPVTRVLHAESEQKVKTRFIHGGQAIFDSGWINTSAPTNTNSSNTASWPITFYTNVQWVFYANSTFYITDTGQIANSPSSYNPFGVVASHPDPDVDINYLTILTISVPVQAGYLLSSGQPDSAVGVATTKGSYLVNANYLSGVSGAKARLVITNSMAGTLDYMTGAHASPWFTSPFLISAIAVKALKQ